MTANYIVRHETCCSCGIDIPVWQYAPYNHDDYNRVYTSAGEKTALCIPCWNRLVNHHVHFGSIGWMWDGVKAEHTRWNQSGLGVARV